MKPLSKVILVISFLLLNVTCSLPTVNAAIPHLINYQGRLTDSSGVPLNGSYQLTFRIYDAETAGNMLWQEIHSGVVISKGIFSLMLGSVTDLELPFDQQYYLDIKVADEVMSPRQRIASSAYAMRAEEANHATQADNANTVGNVEVSTTPAPNKILPLNGSAKIPSSALGLKAYDSGWFAASANTSYVKIHNLGTTKCLITIMASANSDGSGNTSTNIGLWEYPIGATPETTMYALSTTTISLRTSVHGIAFFLDGSGVSVNLASGYLRIIMLALE